MLVTILCSVIVCVLTYILNKLFKSINKQSEVIKANTEGTKCLLWFRLSDDYDKYMKLGYCSKEEKHRIEETYTAYHTLGGNGVGTNMYQELLNLPNNKTDRE